jgi:hypothetical protein
MPTERRRELGTMSVSVQSGAQQLMRMLRMEGRGVVALRMRPKRPCLVVPGEKVLVFCFVEDRIGVQGSQ